MHTWIIVWKWFKQRKWRVFLFN